MGLTRRGIILIVLGIILFMFGSIVTYGYNPYSLAQGVASYLGIVFVIIGIILILYGRFKKKAPVGVQ